MHKEIEAPFLSGRPRAGVCFEAPFISRKATLAFFVQTEGLQSGPHRRLRRGHAIAENLGIQIFAEPGGS